MIPKIKKPRNKVLFFGSLLIIGAGFFISWKIFFSNPKESLQNFTNGSVTDGEPGEFIGTDEGESTLDEDLSGTPTPAEIRETKNFVVDAAICEDECGVYQNNPQALIYCQAVCGLPSSEGAARPNPADCNGAAEGMSKDICLRDKAVAENNSELCEDITDKSLRDSCRNRIAEERFD